MQTSRLTYIITWISLCVLLAGIVLLVAFSWNSQLSGSFSPAILVTVWFLTSAAGIYLFMLAVKKAHRQWITEKREEEKAQSSAERHTPAADRKKRTMDFAATARKIVRRTPENAALEELGKGLLKNLARELEIMSGIFYLEKKGTFEAASTYALVSSHKPYEFKLGEGLTGQAARNQQLLVISSIPEEYLEVFSGLGKALPSYLAIVPLIHKGHTVALIECTGYKYNPQEIENMFRILSRELMSKLSPNLS
jgi:hypothetical protein